ILNQGWATLMGVGATKKSELIRRDRSSLLMKKLLIHNQISKLHLEYSTIITLNNHSRPRQSS
uniref:Uncharacterized protein n=1 Tax=Oncorhynchus tshawytscha TaxID=74940 RepID=A0AAZ3SCZ7_ONCTS